MKYLNKFLLALFIFVSGSIFAGELKWYSFEEALTKAKTENKIILIDFYTDWCGWCKKMDRETYTDNDVISKIRKGFVPVKLNPEKENYFKINDQTVSAAQLSESAGVRGFPSTAFFTNDLMLIDNISGYLDAETFEKLLDFMSSEKYEQISFQDYRLFKELETMGKSNPGDTDLNYLLGYFHLRFFDDPSAAVQNFNSALNNNSDMKELYAGLYLTHSRLNNANEADKWLKKAESKGYKNKEELDKKAVELVRRLFSQNN